MAGLTKEERAKKEAAEREQLRREIEEEMRSKLTVSVNSNELRNENELLKQQIAEMKEMFEKLRNQSVKQEYHAPDEMCEAFSNIDMNTRIPVTSITTGGVNLKTSNEGSARHFRFEKLGQTIPIIYEHLINCINTDRWLFEDGLVYINNRQVIEEQYLEDAYKNFLTPSTIENILDFDTDTIVEMVGSTTPAIQESIVDIAVQKINQGGSVDLNKINAIGNACRINIMELANKLK